MMRVGIDIRPLLFTRAGIFTYVANLLRHMPAEAEFYLFGSSRSGMEWNRGDFREITLRFPHLNRLCESVWQDILLPQAVRRNKIGVLHGPRFYVPPTCAAGVVTIHDCAFRKIPGLVDDGTARYFDSLIRRGLRSSRAVIAISRSTAEDLAGIYGARVGNITVIPPACGGEFSVMDRVEACRKVAERFGVKRPFLLAVGAREPRKNINRLIRAFGLPGIPDDLQLVVAGGSGRGGMPHVDGGRVFFPGYVDTADLVCLYNAAEAFVFPSLYEGFGIPVLEAMACGCPVICSNTSSLKEFFSGASVQVDPQDVAAIAQGIVRVLSDSALRAELRREGAAKAREFSWERCARETFAVYRSVAR